MAVSGPPLSQPVSWNPPAPYVNGYVYTTGPLALGSSCNAPILDIKNTTAAPIVIFYEDLLTPNTQGLANRQIIAPKGHILISNFLPTQAPERQAHLRIEDIFGNVQSYVFVHDLEAGYSFEPVSEESTRCGLRLRSSSSAFVPEFCGCRQPRWKGNVYLSYNVVS